MYIENMTVVIFFTQFSDLAIYLLQVSTAVWMEVWSAFKTKVYSEKNINRVY